MNPHVTIATLEGDAPLMAGWWTDVKRSGVGQTISDASDSVVGGLATGARMTKNVYSEYVRPGANVVADTASFTGNVLTGQWGTAAKQAQSGFTDTLSFLERQGQPGAEGEYTGLPDTDSGAGLIIAGVGAVGLLWLLTRK